MKLSTFDLEQIRALHHLLEEGSVARAAAHLRITPAAASNALRRLREALGDPLLVKRGRGLVLTRIGEELRTPAREVLAAAERLLEQARPFQPSTYRGSLPVAMSEHVAAVLLPGLDAHLRKEAPLAVLNLAAIPEDVESWLLRTAGVLVGPTGPSAVPLARGNLHAEAFYTDRYVCVMRKGNPAATRRWTAAVYAAQEHVLVTPRGGSLTSDVDAQLAQLGLARHIARTVPSFTLALSLVSRSDFITTMPERCARGAPLGQVVIRKLPLPPIPVAMQLVTHVAHAGDGRLAFIRQALRAARAAQEP